MHNMHSDSQAASSVDLAAPKALALKQHEE